MRIVHLDAKPHLPDSIKLWNGDSRGHWEGNTLVVDVRNNNGKARLARTGEFSSESVAIEERYVFASDGLRYVYEATYTDPTVYTRPWTVTIPNKKYSADATPDDWHYQAWDAVHEGRGWRSAAGRSAPHHDRVMRMRDLARWNDEPGRTRGDVLAALDRAAAGVVRRTVEPVRV